MALRMFSGFEAGTTAEAHDLLGSGAAVQGTGGGHPIRGGVFSGGTAASTTFTCAFGFRGISATGVGATLSDATLYYGFAFRVDIAPAANNEPFCRVMDTAIAQKAEVRINSSRNLLVYNAAGTLVNTGSTVLALDTWYYIEFVCGTGATSSYELKINGTTELSGTGAFGTSNHGAIYLGKAINRNGQSVGYFFDDFYAETTGFLSSTSGNVYVQALRPNAAGDSAGWTNGTSSVYTAVSEYFPDDDTTYIQASATEDNLYSTFHVNNTSAAEQPVTGTIKGVMGYVRAKTASVSGSSLVALRIRNGSTNSDNTQAEITVAYLSYKRLLETDPATAAAWTSGGVDTVQIGMVAGTLAQTQRFTHAMVFVLEVVAVAVNIDATVVSILDEISAVLNTTVVVPVDTTIDSDIDEVTASLAAQQQYLLTVVSTPAEVRAALNLLVVSTVTNVASTIREVSASLTLAQTDFVQIQSTTDEVSGSLTVAQPFAVRIVSTIDEVSAALSAAQSYLVTIDSDIDEVSGSLTVAQRQLVTVSSVLDEVNGSLTVVQSQLVTLSSVLDEVSGALNVEQIGGLPVSLTIGTTLREVSGSLTVAQSQLLTIASSIDEVTASLSAAMNYQATVVSVLDEVTASLTVAQSQFVNVVSVIDEVMASLEVALQPRVTIQSAIDEVFASLVVEMELPGCSFSGGFSSGFVVCPPVDFEIDAILDEVSAILNAQQRYGITIQSVIREVTASLAAAQTDFVQIATTIEEVMAALTLQQQGAVTIVSTIDKVLAALTIQQRQLVNVSTTIREVSASLTLVMHPALAIVSTIDEVQASLAIEMTVAAPLLTIGATIDEVTASLTVAQSQLVSIETTIDEVTAALNVAMLPFLAINSTIDEVSASLSVNVELIVRLTIGTTLAEASASLNLLQYVFITQLQSTIDEVTAQIFIGQIYYLAIISTIDEVSASLNAQQQTGVTITSTIDEVEGSFRVFSPIFVFSRGNISFGMQTVAFAPANTGQASRTIMFQPKADLHRLRTVRGGGR